MLSLILYILHMTYDYIIVSYYYIPIKYICSCYSTAAIILKQSSTGHMRQSNEFGKYIIILSSQWKTYTTNMQCIALGTE